MKKTYITWLSVLVLSLFNSCARNPVTGGRDLMLMSTEQEIAMGKESDPQIIQTFGLYKDEKLQNFITEKGKQMAAVSHRKDLPYEFKIVDSPVLNAFAVPGGYVYFTRGIMAHFNNEAEFAGVLGHEIGHITARHSAQQYSKQMLAQVGMVVGMVASPQFAQFAEAAQQGVSLLFLKFGRDDERESDRLGVEYSTKIGYDAQQMAQFFNTLHRQSAASGQEALPGFLSTHPSPEDRLVRVSELATEWKQKLNATDLEVNRNSYLRMIDGLIYGEDPKQGFVENGTFYHPQLKFQYSVPSGWATQNSPSQVQMAPQDGKALLILRLVPGESLETAAQQMVEQNKLTVVQSAKETVNGLPALAMIADVQQDPQQQQQQQQQQQSIRLLTYLIQYGGNIYGLMGVTTAADFNQYAPLFQTSMKSFRQVTDQAVLNRQPERVRIKTVKQAGTLASALRENAVQDDKMEELAILNGMTLQDPVTQGMLIKVIER